jgi:DNA topoisomerase-2
MEAKAGEFDALKHQSEKDLWCQDLDAFVEEWETQLKEEEDYQKEIRNTKRRTSKKIGAGKNAGKGKAKNDDDYAPKVPKSKQVVPKVEPKTHQRFLTMFESKPKPKAKTNSFGEDGADDAGAASGLSDDDFEALTKPVKKETSRAPSEQPGLSNGRTKRAAAAAPKKWVEDLDDDESESDGGDLLGDVANMVKGIGNEAKTDNPSSTNRLSLFNMSRPGSSHGKSTGTELPKLKTKPSRNFNFSDDADETNYEMLAKSSPHKPSAPRDNLDSFLSDDDDEDLVPVTKKIPTKAPARKVAPKAKPAPKAKQAPVKKAVEAPKTLSPAAKAYAAKQNKTKTTSRKIVSDDEDEDEDVLMADDVDDEPEVDDSPPVRARGRPARAAAVAKPKGKPIYVASSDEELEDAGSEEESDVEVEEEESEDDFSD